MQWWERLKAKWTHRPFAAEDDDEEFFLTQEADLNFDRDPFLHSLQELTPEDIRLSKPPRVRTRGERVMDGVRSVLLGICICVLIGSSIMLVDNFVQKQRGTELYDEAAEEFAAADLNFGFEEDVISGETTGGIDRLRSVRRDTAAVSLTQVRAQTDSLNGDIGESDANSEYKEQLEKLRAVLRSYKQYNEDVYGYISIPAVGLEYVVVQGEDNDFYLNHNYKKESLVIGSIFVDYRCSNKMYKNFNTVLYGHNIETNGGAMFHQVTEFLNKDVFDNALIYMYTMDGVYIFKAFSVYSTKPDSGYIRTSFTSYEDYGAFAAKMKARSRIANNVVVGPEDRMITLSTCTNYNNGRYALHAVLIDYIN